MQNQTTPTYPNGIPSPAVSPMADPNLEYKDIFYQLEQTIGADVEHLKNLVQKGIIKKEQGEYLLSQLAHRAQQINAYKNSVQQNAAVQAQAQVQAPVQDSMELFNQEHPGFFDVESRKEVLDYIKGFGMDKDEILRISKLIEGLENSAVEKYLKKSEYEKSLNDENALAKSKLTAYAQNAPSDSNMNRIFTREEIGNMSGEEFTKNEKAIMEQLKQGLIK